MLTRLPLLTLMTFALVSGPAIAAEPTAVNDQITDSVTQTDEKADVKTDKKTDEKAEGDAPAMAMGNLYKATSQDLDEEADKGKASKQDTKTGETKAKDKAE